MRRRPFKLSTSPSAKFSLVRSRQQEGAQPGSQLERVALCCLSTLCRDMHPDIPCAGFIHGNEEGAPKMPEDTFSEEL